MNHTPGPWILSDEICPLVIAPGAPYIAQVLMYTDGETGSLRSTAGADARLIAAAPDLLAALIDAADAMAIHCPDAWALVQAREIIAALEG